MSSNAAARRPSSTSMAAWWPLLLLLVPPRLLLAESVERAWTVSVPADGAVARDYKTACAGPSSDRLRLLITTASEEGAPREVAIQNVGPDGAVDLFTLLTKLASPEDPLNDAYRCLPLRTEDLLIVGSTRAGALIAVESSDGAWKPALRLGTGGDEVEVYDLVQLGDGRFVVVGTDRQRGLIVIFDLENGSVRSQPWGDGETPSIVLDAEPTASGFTACGVEGGGGNELFSATSDWFAASYDLAGVLQREIRRRGRVCRLLNSDRSGTATRVLYDAGAETLGPLRLLSLDQSLEPVGQEQVLLERIAYYYDLAAAATASTFAVLDQPVAFERIQVFERSSGRWVGSPRLGFVPAGTLDLAAGEKLYFVISQPPDPASGRRAIRVDAFAAP